MYSSSAPASAMKWLEPVKGLRLFRAGDRAAQAGVLSVQHSLMDAESCAEILGKRGIAVRSGLHCAPLAHKSAGTKESGTVRFSFSPLLGWHELRAAAQIVEEIFESGYKM